ncbi:MAG: DUF1146 family protein [Bacilli bacterium]
MNDRILVMWFFILFIPMVYLVYNLFTIFNYEKILRANKVPQLKLLLMIISVGISYLFAESIIAVIEKISIFL